MPGNRRRFLKSSLLYGATALTFGKPLKGSAQTSDRAIRTVRTPVLEIAYEEHGDAAAYPVVLLHGFPYDPRSFDGVAAPLAAAGFRVLVPYLRGYGPTRFLDPAAPRMAEQAAIAQDFVDFCAALNLPAVAVAGFDWGNRAACIAAITDPQLIRGFVSIGGYSIQNTTVSGGPAPAALEARLWYQWYFNTERGRVGLERNRHDIIRYLWETWSPTWNYTDEAYQRSAPTFDNPDFVEVVIHSYRHRHANALGEERFLELEAELAQRPPVSVPTIVLHGADSGFGPPSADPSGDQTSFSNLAARRIVAGAGHDLPVQRPAAVVDALRELLA
jgi:pimeloyl-ACP methyl ester carboxylesterase